MHCRRQNVEYEGDKQGWKDWNKAVQMEKERQKRMKESGQEVEPGPGESSKEETARVS